MILINPEFPSFIAGGADQVCWRNQQREVGDGGGDQVLQCPLQKSSCIVVVAASSYAHGALPTSRGGVGHGAMGADSNL